MRAYELECSLRVRIQPLLGGISLAAPVAPIVEEEHGGTHVAMQQPKVVEAVADVTRVPVKPDPDHFAPA